MSRSISFFAFLILVGSFYLSSEAFAEGGIQMLPPKQSNNESSVCKNGEGNKVLTWDGARSLKCNPSATISDEGNVGIGTLPTEYKLDVLGAVRNKSLMLDADIAANMGGHLTINRQSKDSQGLIAFRGVEEPYMYGSIGVNSGKGSLDILSLTPHDVVIGSYLNAVDRNDTIVVKPNGNVGFGKSDPSYKVDITGDLRATHIYLDTKIAHNGGGHIAVTRDGLANQAFMAFVDKEISHQLGTIGIPSNTNNFQLASFNGADLGIIAGGGTVIPGATSSLRLYSTGDTYIETGGARRITLPKTGMVGIGTTTPGYALHVNGTAYATAAGGALSDERHKEKIKTLELPALETLSKMRPVTFFWKNVEDAGMKGEQIGFIAQEVEKVLPQVVLTQNNEEKTKGIKYDEIIPVLTKAIVELSDQNKKLQESLDARIKALETAAAK
jgi:hypothetical protein